MLGNIVQFDREQPEEARPVPLPGSPQASTSAGTLLLPQLTHKKVERESSGHDLQWMQQMIDQQVRLFEAAQRERAQAMTELKRIAQTLCQQGWDARMRAGDNPEAWPPTAIADLIIQSLQLELRHAVLSQDPELAEKHQQLVGELSQSRAENQNLRHRLQAAEQAVSMQRNENARAASNRKMVGDFRAGRDGKATSPQNNGEPIRVLPALTVAPESLPQEGNLSTPRSSGSGVERVDDVVQVIAELGLCRWKDISAYLAKKWNVRPSAGTLDTVIKKALTLDLLYIEEVRLEWGGKPTGKMLILTRAGETCAQSLGLTVVESQYVRGLAAHKDASHFYAILEVAGILANYFGEVDCFPASIPMEQGRYFADLTAVAADGERLFIEVERGTYKSDQDREKKWVRAATANGGLIYLATPNQETLETIVSEISATRERHPDHIKTIKAFSVRAYRDQKASLLNAPWIFEG